MRLINLFTVSLAAMTFFSCSNDMDEPVKGDFLNPGEARIEFDLTGGKTTYATADQEKAIKDKLYALYSQGGDSIGYVKNSTDNLNKVSFTISAANVKKYKGQPVTLAVATNVKQYGVTMPENSALPVLIVGDQTTDDKGGVAKGLSASASVEFVLAEGVNTIPSKKLVRVTARLGVKGTGISGYKVKYTSKPSAKLLPNGVSTETNTGYTHTYAIAADPTETNGVAIGYAYPQNEAFTVEVTSPDAMKKTVTIPALVSNHSYGIIILPKKPGTGTGTGSGDFAIEIADWGTDSDTNVDFTANSIPLTLKPGATVPKGFSITDGKLFVESTLERLTLVDLTNIFNQKVVGIGAPSFTPPTFAVEAGTSAISPDGKLKVAMDSEENAGMYFQALYNYGADKTYKIYCKYSDTGRPTENAYFDITVKGFNYPESFTETFDGAEFAQVNTTGSRVGDINLFNKINVKTGATFAQKVVAYVNRDPVKRKEVLGKQFSVTTVRQPGTCPDGFTVPTMNELSKIFGKPFATTPFKRQLVLGTPYTTAGTSTMTWKKYAEAGGIGEFNTYVIIKTGGKEAFMLSNSNMTSSTRISAQSNNRYVMWNGEWQYGNTIGTSRLVDGSVRCVKKVQSALVK